MRQMTKILIVVSILVVILVTIFLYKKQKPENFGDAASACGIADDNEHALIKALTNYTVDGETAKAVVKDPSGSTSLLISGNSADVSAFINGFPVYCTTDTNTVCTYERNCSTATGGFISIIQKLCGSTSTKPITDPVVVTGLFKDIFGSNLRVLPGGDFLLYLFEKGDGYVIPAANAITSCVEIVCPQSSLKFQMVMLAF